MIPSVIDSCPNLSLSYIYTIRSFASLNILCSVGFCHMIDLSAHIRFRVHGSKICRVVRHLSLTRRSPGKWLHRYE